MRRPAFTLTLAATAIAFIACSDSTSVKAVASVAVTGGTPAIFIGDTRQLTATTADANGGALTGRTVTWSTSDAGKATVSTTGLVTGVAQGTATITATSEGKSATAVVTVASKTVTFTATMNGASEVPANASTATGTFIGVLDTTTNVFTYDFTFTGLSSNVNNGHIHGPSTTTATAGTTINFNTLPGATFIGFGAAPAGSGHGVATLTAATAITATMNGDSLKKLLFAGLTYANIHSANIGSGEIRGQITKQP